MSPIAEKKPRGMINETDQAIGARLRLARINKGLSQEAFGEKLGVTFQQIQKYEKGVNRLSGSRLVQAAKILEVTVADLVGASADDTGGFPLFSGSALKAARLIDGLPPALRPRALSVLQGLADMANDQQRAPADAPETHSTAP